MVRLNLQRGDPPTSPAFAGLPAADPRDQQAAGPGPHGEAFLGPGQAPALLQSQVGLDSQMAAGHTQTSPSVRQRLVWLLCTHLGTDWLCPAPGWHVGLFQVHDVEPDNSERERTGLRLNPGPEFKSKQHPFRTASGTLSQTRSNAVVKQVPACPWEALPPVIWPRALLSGWAGSVSRGRL